MDKKGHPAPPAPFKFPGKSSGFSVRPDRFERTTFGFEGCLIAPK
jgi:hypothetical protein